MDKLEEEFRKFLREYTVSSRSDVFYRMDMRSAYLAGRQSSQARETENKLIHVEMLLYAIVEALKGKEPSDFELSFGIVRDVWDLYNLCQSSQDQPLCTCEKPTILSVDYCGVCGKDMRPRVIKEDGL